MDKFCEEHKDCEKVWKQPEPDMTLSIPERAKWWTIHGEHGTSSKTIWNVLAQDTMGDTKFDHEHLEKVLIPPSQYGHPYDADDFKRCYLLLKAIPEWRERLHEMKKWSPVWSKLVNNWGYLTNYYEAYLKGGGDHLLSELNTVIKMYL
jgi:hypothetical protein